MLAPSLLEQRVFTAVRGAVPESVVPALRAVSALGDHRVIWPVVGGVGLFAYARTRRWPESVWPVAWLGGATGVRRLVAEVAHRERPDALYWRAAASGFGYPSRHTALATVGWGLAASSLPRSSRGWAVPVAVGVAVAVGLTRVPLGVHWPGDVLAGWAFGIGTLMIGRTRTARRTFRARDGDLGAAVDIY